MRTSKTFHEPGRADLPVGPDAWSAWRQAEQRVPARFTGREQVRKEREALHGLRPKTATAGKVEQNSTPPADAAGQKTLAQGGLSPQPARVAELVTQGLSDCEIAAELGLSEETVGSYLKIIFRRFSVHSRTALATRVNAKTGSKSAGFECNAIPTNVGIAEKRRNKYKTWYELRPGDCNPV